MRSLAKFLALLELTREQPQYGYFLSGVRAYETSNLAEHHYLVTMIAWMLCEHINDETRLVNTDEVIRMCLVHDLGELFGGDISAPLSRRRPDMKVHARALEAANIDLLTSLLSPAVRERVLETHRRAESKDTDEAVVAKFADMMETQFFLEHLGSHSPHRTPFYLNHIRPLVEHVRDERIRVKLRTFLDGFDEHVRDKGSIAGSFLLT